MFSPGRKAAAAGAGADGTGAGAAAAPPAPRVFVIPTSDGEDIRLAADELPPNADEIIEVLLAVTAPLSIWHAICGEYYRQGAVGEAAKISATSRNPELFATYASPEHFAPRARLFLAGAQCEVHPEARTGKTRPEAHKAAMDLIAVAETISNQFLEGQLRAEVAAMRVAVEVTQVAHAATPEARATATAALQGALKAAREADAAATASVQATGPSPGCLAARIAALQADAMLAYHAGDFVKAREHLVTVIKLSPGCDPTVRVSAV